MSGEHKVNVAEVGSITEYIPYVHLASTTDAIQMTNASRLYTLLFIIVNKIVNKNGMGTRVWGYKSCTRTAALCGDSLCSHA